MCSIFTADKAGGCGVLSHDGLAFPSSGAGSLSVLPDPGRFVCHQFSSLTSDQNQTEQFTFQKGCQRIGAPVSKARKGRKTFLPKLTKPKPDKQKKKQSSQHHGCLGGEALKKPTEEPQGSPLSLDPP